MPRAKGKRKSNGKAGEPVWPAAGSLFGRPPKRPRLATESNCPVTQEAVYKRNCEHSAFLKLPAELRNRIYEQALGNKVIHISVRDTAWNDSCAWSYEQYYKDGLQASHAFLKVTHAVCSSEPDGEDRAYERSRRRDESYDPEEHGSDLFKGGFPSRHGQCYGALAAIKKNWVRSDLDAWMVYPKTLPTTNLRYRLDLALLGVSRQVNQEAALIPYATNTFAFHEGRTFRLFFSHSLIDAQRRAIQSILSDDWLIDSSWQGACCASNMQMLQGVRTFRASFQRDIRPYIRLADNCIMAFALLHLDTVELIVESDSTTGNSRTSRRTLAKQIEDQLRGN